MTVDEMRHVFPDYRAKEERIVQDIITRIVEIFRDRGYAIPRETAAECWRQYSYDCQETERLVDLRPTDRETCAVVMGYYPGVLAGLEDRDAAAIRPLPA